MALVVVVEQVMLPAHMLVVVVVDTLAVELLVKLPRADLAVQGVHLWGLPI